MASDIMDAPDIMDTGDASILSSIDLEDIGDIPPFLDLDWVLNSRPTLMAPNQANGIPRLDYITGASDVIPNVGNLGDSATVNGISQEAPLDLTTSTNSFENQTIFPTSSSDLNIPNIPDFFFTDPVGNPLPTHHTSVVIDLTDDQPSQSPVIEPSTVNSLLQQLVHDDTLDNSFELPHDVIDLNASRDPLHLHSVINNSSESASSVSPLQDDFESWTTNFAANLPMPCVESHREKLNNDEGNGDLDRLFETLNEDDKTSMAEPTKAIEATLYPHQKQALHWMMFRENGGSLPPFWTETQPGRFYNSLMRHEQADPPDFIRGGILADDMGLGKTLQMISLIMTNFVNSRPLAVPVPGRPRKNRKHKRENYEGSALDASVGQDRNYTETVQEGSMDYSSESTESTSESFTNSPSQTNERNYLPAKLRFKANVLGESDNTSLSKPLEKSPSVYSRLTGEGNSPKSTLARKAQMEVDELAEIVQCKKRKHCNDTDLNTGRVELEAEILRQCFETDVRINSPQSSNHNSPQICTDVNSPQSSNRNSPQIYTDVNTRSPKSCTHDQPESSFSIIGDECDTPQQENTHTNKDNQTSDISQQKDTHMDDDNQQCDITQPEDTNTDDDNQTSDITQPEDTHSNGDNQTCDITQPEDTHTNNDNQTCDITQPEDTHTNNDNQTCDITEPEDTHTNDVNQTCDITQVIDTRDITVNNAISVSDATDVGVIIQIDDIPTTTDCKSEIDIQIDHETNMGNTAINDKTDHNANHVGVIKQVSYYSDISDDDDYKDDTSQLCDTKANVDIPARDNQTSAPNNDMMTSDNASTKIHNISIKEGCEIPSDNQDPRGDIGQPCFDIGETQNDLVIDIGTDSASEGDKSCDDNDVRISESADDIDSDEELQLISELQDPVVQEFMTRNSCDESGRTCHAGPRATLILCPLSVLSNWQDQFEHHLHPNVHINIHQYYGSARCKNMEQLKQNDVVITTYGTLLMEYKALQASGKSLLMEMEWLRVVLDEGHCIRNPTAKQTKAVLALNTERKWVLTGTPVQNKILDLWPLMKFLNIRPLTERSYWKHTIEKPLQRNRKSAFRTIQHLMGSIAMRRTKNMVNSDGEPLVRLPDRSVFIEHIKMSPEETKFYQTMEEEGRVVIKKYANREQLMEKYILVLEIMLRLRQMCCHRGLLPQEHIVDEEEKEKEEDARQKQETLIKKLAVIAESEEECSVCVDSLKSPIILPCSHYFCHQCILSSIEHKEKENKDSASCPMCRFPISKQDIIELPPDKKFEPQVYGEWNSSTKVDALMSGLVKLRDEDVSIKSLVVSQFTSFLTLIQTPLTEMGFKYVRLDGKMTAAQRLDAIHRFSDTSPGSPTVFLISLRAGGVGLNLTAASRVFLMEPHWNPATEEQCFDRCHRLGQTRDVVITKFVSEDTIEERMLALQEKKRQLMNKSFKKRETAVERNRQRTQEIRQLMMIN